MTIRFVKPNNTLSEKNNIPPISREPREPFSWRKKCSYFNYRKENSDDNRDLSTTSLYQHMTDKPFDLTESSKFSFTRSEFDDTDSRFSFSNSSSSPVQTGNGIDRDLTEQDFPDNLRHGGRSLLQHDSSLGVQVISSSGGHIIAVANPALALSPALAEAITIKREAMSPDL